MREVLGAIAAATIGVAGTTFSITVAALTLASNQMGPRLLRNFTRDAGNQYALGALVATFAYALVALRAVPEAEEGAFVPQLAVSVGILLAFGRVGVLIWFLHHIANSINVDRVVALVHGDLSAAVAALPSRDEVVAAEKDAEEARAEPAAALRARSGGYLRVLEDATLADWAEERGALLRLRVRPGDFVFSGGVIGAVAPVAAHDEAAAVLERSMVLGDSRSVEQDLEFAVRQLVEVGLRALSPSLNDPFTAITVLDRLSATLCELTGRALPDGCTRRGGRLRLERPATDYAGLLDAMFHMLRQAALSQPAVLIRLLEVLAEVATVEPDPVRRRALRRHADLACEAVQGDTADLSVRAVAGAWAVLDRRRAPARLLLLALLVALGAQLHRLWPYTPLHPTQAPAIAACTPGDRLSVLAVNLRASNRGPHRSSRRYGAPGPMSSSWWRWTHAGPRPCGRSRRTTRTGWSTHGTTTGDWRSMPVPSWSSPRSATS